MLAWKCSGSPLGYFQRQLVHRVWCLIIWGRGNEHILSICWAWYFIIIISIYLGEPRSFSWRKDHPPLSQNTAQAEADQTLPLFNCLCGSCRSWECLSYWDKKSQLISADPFLWLTMTRSTQVPGYGRLLISFLPALCLVSNDCIQTPKYHCDYVAN